MIYEVRDYHIRPDLLEAYKVWADVAVPVLRDHMDVVGFWIDDTGCEPEIKGSDPINSPIGEANVCWVIRWADKATRDACLAEVFASAAWKGVWARHPDPNGYQQASSRFMSAV
jgi:hypothetical protein